MAQAMGRWRMLANVGFAVIVLAVAAFGLMQVANRRWQTQPTFHVRAQFPSVVGVEPGHRVRFQGIDAGVVERVVPPSRPGDPVELVLRIDETLHRLVREDTTARIAVEGMIGARVVDLKPGEPDAPAAPEGALIRSEAPTDLADLMRQAGESLRKFDATATEARSGLEHLAALAGEVRAGKGSLGKLIQDDSVYDNLVALTRKGEKAVETLDDDLTAIKQTWPISRYFESRAYYERDLVLYRPGALRESRSLTSEELFEPGLAVLTPVGKTRLDEVARWFRKTSRQKSEVVIAAFTDPDADPDLADALTQEQADAVRKYLVDQHGIGSAGWFRSRKVAAVGFGGQAPRLAENVDELPARRIEIILFTPQA
ncbi:MlaD family protein [Planctomyces sp. SH-PL62]|uniref:MlaD family protein n=1 Tax=Planctomyces sp. SH-PL62 TaxID=1636152 RepID=UPI00078CEC72|nr:MlaD family protein [Planctomyces sp. SH-PL62]AMV36120.1 OmpA family protein [Planctomyces sp. SH-PL62]